MRSPHRFLPGIVGAGLVLIAFAACAPLARTSAEAETLHGDSQKGYVENGVLASILDSENEKASNRAAP